MLKGSGVAGEWTDAFESDSSVIYALDQDFRIVHCNLAWDRFALENGGTGATREHQLGRCVFDAIPEQLKPFYKTLYDRVRETKQGYSHVMECSSPELFRRFHMNMRPFGDSGVLTVSSLLDETPQEGCGPDEDRSYIDTHGLITVCAHCRRTRSEAHAPRWEWVPRFLRNDRRISHGLCPVCVNYHYGLTIH